MIKDSGFQCPSCGAYEIYANSAGWFCDECGCGVSGGSPCTSQEDYNHSWAEHVEVLRQEQKAEGE